MEQQVEFNTSFRGFDKKDVLSYIYEQNKRMQELQEELDRRSEEAGQAVQLQQKMRMELDQLQRQFQVLRTRQQAESKTPPPPVVDVAKITSNLEAELENQKRIAAQKDREIKAVTEKNRLLQSKIEELESKGKKYDDLSAQIGKVIIEAKASAEEIIEKAKTDAGVLTANALTSSSGFISELESLKTGVQKLKETARVISSDLTARAQTMEVLLEDASRRIQDNVIVPAQPPAQEETAKEFTFDSLFQDDND